ncbi:MAG: PAS domain-containing protein [Bacteroidales bacterium]
MRFPRLTIRSKLFLSAGLTAVLSLLMLLFLLQGYQQLSRDRNALNGRIGIWTQYRELEGLLTRESLRGNPEQTRVLLQTIREFRTACAEELERTHEQNENDDPLLSKALTRAEYLESLWEDPSQTNGTMERSREHRLILLDMMTEYQSGLDARQRELQRNTLLLIGLAMGFLLLLAYLSNLLVIRNFSLSWQKLKAFSARLAQGQLPEIPNAETEDECGEVAGDLRLLVETLAEKRDYLKLISRDGHGSLYTPPDGDELGQALRMLSDHLTRKELEEVSRNREDKRQNWVSEGMAQLGEILRSERENVVELSHRIVQKLVAYMNVEMGAMFVSQQREGASPILELTASYAFDRRKYRTKTVELGDGLAGTCAQEKEKIFLTEVPEEYFELRSGTGSSKPNCILLVPLMMNGTVYGVLELATVRLLRPFEIEFVESLSEPIASSIQAVQSNERTAVLLNQSQTQAEILKQQETRMKDSVKDLETAQEESRKKESEIHGILNAINQSALVAELGLNGRFSHVNDRFVLQMESHRDQIIGKPHSEFAKVDPYSEEYKEFWNRLRKGETVSNTETYVLFSGKEIHLHQTFTPLVNERGRVYKILNIAEDVTETTELHALLGKQEQAMERKGLDMQSLQAAVNSAFVKCELDAEGVILDVNDKYNEITGLNRKELLGRNYRTFLQELEKDQFERVWTEVLKEKSFEGTMRRTKPTGEEVWLAATLTPVKDEHGVIYKVYLMGLDVTEKRLKYQLLEEANKEIDRLRSLMQKP